MANARYRKIKEIGAEFYFQGSPVQIESCTILQDTQVSRWLVQLQLRNMTERALGSLYFSYRLKDGSGSVLEEKQTVYKDINCAAGAAFGANRPIVTEQMVVEDISISLQRVVWTDGQEEDLSDYSEYRIPAQSALTAEFSPQEIEEISKEMAFAARSAPMTLVPREVDNAVWQCFCGTWNKADLCTRCGAERQKVMASCDHAALAERMRSAQSISSDGTVQSISSDGTAQSVSSDGTAQGRKKPSPVKKILVPAAIMLLVIIGAVAAPFLTQTGNQKMMAELMKTCGLSVRVDGAEVRGWGDTLEHAARENGFTVLDAAGETVTFSGKGSGEPEVYLIETDRASGSLDAGYFAGAENKVPFVILHDCANVSADGTKAALKVNNLGIGSNINDFYDWQPEKSWKKAADTSSVSETENQVDSLTMHYSKLFTDMYCRVLVDYETGTGLVEGLEIQFYNKAE